ncbi:MAG TPA: hypothetical protein VL400_18535, partial [Polyangiaceae bacterium]|nr:hypothetical protein [Polyangiaceae bacterium]
MLMRSRGALLAVGTGLFFGTAACNVYDESLLTPTGSGGGSTTTTTTSSMTTSSGGSGTGGGSGGCDVAGDCPGMDGECGTRTCTNHVCGVDAAPNGTAVAMQTAGDCSKNVCDGAGDVTTQNDDSDKENDNNDCTTDTCSMGAPMHTPIGEGMACGGGTKVCTAAGDCVDCVDDLDCLSLVCDMTTNTCSPASCGDAVKNGTETDLNCGGTACPPCDNGAMCLVNTDCVSNKCATTCQPSCTDGLENQNETDVDCGGMCGACDVGQGCSVDGDCLSGNCAGTTCGEYQILVSEFRGRGPGGGTDDFIELYNPRSVAVTLGGDIEVLTRSDTAASYSVKFTGGGQVIPAHAHFLLAGGGYTGTALPDQKEAAGTGLVTDKASVVIRRGTTVLDAACLYCGTTNPFGTGYTCEGTPIVLTGCTSSNTDKSVERKPGGAAGNGTDTGDTSMDFSIV